MAKCHLQGVHQHKEATGMVEDAYKPPPTVGFKIKCNHAYHVQLDACGYSQMPSIDFFKNYSLVVNKATFCIFLLMVIHFTSARCLYSLPLDPNNGTLAESF